MISLIIFLLTLAILGVIFGSFKTSNYFKLGSRGEKNPNVLQIVKTVGVIVASMVVASIQPLSLQRIDAGNVGLAIDRIGNDKGIPKTRDVKGWVFYNSWTTDVIEYSVRQQHVEYNVFNVPSKGGSLIPVGPSFNISLRPEASAEVYIHLTKSEDVVESVKNGWLATATNIALTDATNLFTPDSIFNNSDNYRIEVEKQLKKQLSRYFTVDQIKPGQQPPQAMVGILQAKANAIQAAQQAELNRLTAVATAEQKIAEARGDSAQLVITAKAEAEAIRLKQIQITPAYVEYIKWLNAADDVPRVPATILGSGSNVLLSR